MNRLTYNSKNIDFAWTYQHESIAQEMVTNRNKAVSGAREVTTVRADVRCRFEWPALLTAGKASDLDLVRKLYQAQSWLARGLSATFAADHTKASSTTLNGAAAAGNSSFAVTSASGFSIGDSCVIRTPTILEVVKIANIVSTTITLEETLNFTYPDAAMFRHEKYWSIYLADPVRDFQIVDLMPRAPFYALTLQFEEAFP